MRGVVVLQCRTVMSSALVLMPFVDCADYTSVLDKIADGSDETTSKAADSTKGVAATAADYITSGNPHMLAQ